MIDERPMLRVFRATFTFMFWALSKPAYYGRENIPATGPFLQVTNHLSYADPPLIFLGLQRTHMVVLAADKYKSNPFFRWVIETAGGVWLNRGAGDRGALKAALEILKGPNILGMAPEGTRSKVTHALQPGKSGAAFIASKAGVPIVPIGLTGTDKVFGKAKRLHRTPITFTAGKPFTLPSLDGRPNKAEALDEYTHEIMCRIAALLPESYQGVYKGDPRIEEIKVGKERW
jgi:1-acyl-sn-glycerol-3-phosphate acyltransferase